MNNYSEHARLSDEWYGLYEPILNALIKRNNPNLNHWYCSADDPANFIYLGNVKCNFCGAIFKMSFNNVKDHGLLHLKEFNLLSII